MTCIGVDDEERVARLPLGVEALPLRRILTHDLDFGTILAQTHATGPSVVQIRSQDTFPSAVGNAVVAALQQCDADLRSGAIVVVDISRLRVRVLPI